MAKSISYVVKSVTLYPADFINKSNETKKSYHIMVHVIEPIPGCENLGFYIDDSERVIDAWIEDEQFVSFVDKAYAKGNKIERETDSENKEQYGSIIVFRDIDDKDVDLCNFRKVITGQFIVRGNLEFTIVKGDYVKIKRDAAGQLTKIETKSGKPIYAHDPYVGYHAGIASGAWMSLEDQMKHFNARWINIDTFDDNDDVSTDDTISESNDKVSNKEE